MDGLQVARATHLVARYSRQLRAIYDDSFPPHERAEFAFLTRSIAAGERWLYTATRGDALLGFAIIVPHVTSDVHLLEYLAVERDARGAGIGGALLNRLTNEFQKSPSALGILLEVEHDEEGDMDERTIRRRRVAFYARYGARLVEGVPNYRVPLTDRAGTMRMKLLWLPIAANAEMPRGDTLRECVKGIFARSYDLKADDTLIQFALRDLS